MNQFPSKLFHLLRSAVADATDLLLLPPVPGLERPGYNQFAATRRYFRLIQKLKNYTALDVNACVDKWVIIKILASRINGKKT
jgi:hypothetical protein